MKKSISQDWCDRVNAEMEKQSRRHLVACLAIAYGVIVFWVWFLHRIGFFS